MRKVDLREEEGGRTWKMDLGEEEGLVGALQSSSSLEVVIKVVPLLQLCMGKLWSSAGGWCSDMFIHGKNSRKRDVKRYI